MTRAREAVNMIDYNSYRFIIASEIRALTFHGVMYHTEYMKRKHARRVHRVTHRSARPNENYLVVVRGWMLVVAFALMLGIGALVGQFINAQLNATTPTVAGASTDY